MIEILPMGTDGGGKYSIDPIYIKFIMREKIIKEGSDSGCYSKKGGNYGHGQS